MSVLPPFDIAEVNVHAVALIRKSRKEFPWKEWAAICWEYHVGIIKEKLTPKENIYTIPNLLTVSRIVACPFLGYAILHGNFHVATGLLVYAGLTDLVRIPPATRPAE